MSTVLILSLLSFFQYKVEIDAKIIRVSGRKVQLEKFCSQEAKNFVEHWPGLWIVFCHAMVPHLLATSLLMSEIIAHCLKQMRKEADKDGA